MEKNIKLGTAVIINDGKALITDFYGTWPMEFKSSEDTFELLLKDGTIITVDRVNTVLIFDENSNMHAIEYASKIVGNNIDAFFEEGASELPAKRISLNKIQK